MKSYISQEKYTYLKTNYKFLMVDKPSIYSYFLEKSHERKIPQAVFFPYWNEKEGMTFGVIIDECFASQQSAQNSMNKLSTEIKENAKIISKWDANTIFINNHVFKCN